jgi:hypothetical protein
MSGAAAAVARYHKLQFDFMLPDALILQYAGEVLDCGR